MKLYFEVSTADASSLVNLVVSMEIKRSHLLTNQSPDIGLRPLKRAKISCACACITNYQICPGAHFINKHRTLPQPS